MSRKQFIEYTDIVPLIREFKKNPKNGVGGNLHIYLDDGNIEDEFVRWCLERCIEREDDLGEAICRLSLKMSYTQRSKLSGAFYEL